MGKVIWHEAEPDDPMYKEEYRSYSPHWAQPFQKPVEAPPLPTPCNCGSGHVRNAIGDDNNNFMFYACPTCYERVLAEYKAGASGKLRGTMTDATDKIGDCLRDLATNADGPRRLDHAEKRIEDVLEWLNAQHLGRGS